MKLSKNESAFLEDLMMNESLKRSKKSDPKQMSNSSRKEEEMGLSKN